MPLRYLWLAALFASLSLSASAQQPPAPPAGQATYNQGLSARAITPSNTTIITPTRAIFIGDASTCNIALRLVRDTAAVTFNNVQPGEILPVQAIQVMSSGTSCSNSVALY